MFKFHYPERGRKQLELLARKQKPDGSNSTTPQGDGNMIGHKLLEERSKKFKFHYPARGRKQVLV